MQGLPWNTLKPKCNDCIAYALDSLIKAARTHFKKFAHLLLLFQFFLLAYFVQQCTDQFTFFFFWGFILKPNAMLGMVLDSAEKVISEVVQEPVIRHVLVY